jgi:hypothetical protein
MVLWWQVQSELVPGLSATKSRGLGLVDLEHFGRALRLRWLWYQWTTLEKPWCIMDLPIHSVDEALFTATTKVTVHNGCKAKFWKSGLVQSQQEEEPVCG